MSGSIDAWIDHAERTLHALARELRGVPMKPSTRHLHLRALELKRKVVRWRDAAPDVPARSAVLEAIETLFREVRVARRPTDHHPRPRTRASSHTEQLLRDPSAGSTGAWSEGQV